MTTPYKHEPFTDFSQEENRKAFEQALAKVTESLGQTYPLVINGERIETKDQIVSINPAKKDEVVGTVSKAGKEEAEQAVQAAAKAFETWRYTSPEERAAVIFRAAASIRRKKHEYSALLVKEAGKPWNEADADTAEAIDFLEYYARQIFGGGERQTSEQPRRRTQSIRIHTNWRDARHSAVELLVCHYGRNNSSTNRYREHSCLKTCKCNSCHCGTFCGRA